MAESPCADPFVIVAGSYRCGSTALFEYLAAHPGVAPSRIKETGYFMPEWMRPGPPMPMTYGATPLSDYLALFGNAAGRVRMEATPAYLHFREAATRIKQALPEVRIVLSLREPAGRLASWFQLAHLLGLVPAEQTFDEYVRLQQPGPVPATRQAFPYSAKEHGRYTRYVADYYEIFGRDRVMVTWLDELRRQPAATMQAIARFTGLDPDFYAAFEPQAVNQAKTIPNRAIYEHYMRARLWLEDRSRAIPPLFSVIRRARVRFEPWLIARLSEPVAPMTVAPALAAELRAFYRDDAAALAELTGREPPWRREYETMQSPQTTGTTTA